MGNYIGVDGGGTKIMVCLEKDGRRFYLKKDYGVNPNDVGYETAECRIITAMTEICRSNNLNEADIRGTFAGIAGLSASNYKEKLKEALDKVFVNASNGASHDGENIIYASFPDSDGVIVICGTGSSCFVRKGNDLYRIGGYSVFDMNGNGYEIARRAIAFTLKTYDGRTERSLLCDYIEEAAGGNCLTKLGDLLAMSIKQTASFAACVFEAAKNGDSNASNIISSSAEYISECINCASLYFDGNYNVCIAGSVGRNPIMFEKIKSKCNINAVVSLLNKDPVEGSVYRARIKT